MGKKFDLQQHYCRKLGHFLSFSYCRREQIDKPCRSIRSCWMDKFDIDQFLQDNFSESDIRHLSAQTAPKISSIIELIAAVQLKLDHS